MKKAIFTIFAILILSSLVLAQSDIVVPYILKAPGPVTIDGSLDEWAFAFPLDHNAKSIPDSSRFATTEGWVPQDPADCSGTLYMMYDEEYLYVAAAVRDDAPGHFSDATWAADAIEFYMGNWDVGDALFPEEHPAGGWPNDAATGDYSLQLTIAFDESQDSIFVNEWYGVGGIIASENTEVVYEIWPDGDGYFIEGKIYLPDLDSPTTGNVFEFTPGTRIPMTWSLYDMDESESSADFAGFAYTPKGYAGWMGVGAGWQVCDVLETPRGDAWNMNSTFDFVAPYIKRAYRPVEIDGVLDEWNWCFPLDHWRSIVPDSGRFRMTEGWLPETDEDCKGTMYMMYDDEYFYFSASVMDDAPGHFSDATWAADAIEYYMGNYDIGDVLFPEAHPTGGWPNDAATGDYSLQLTVAFDESQDSIFVNEWYGVGGIIASENTEVVYEIWPDGDGYNLEGKIYLPDLDSPTTGNVFEFTPGYRIPMTWSLYDMDESESSADFQGIAYTRNGFAGWMGIGAGWQYCDVKGITLIDYIDEVAKGTSVDRFVKKAAPSDFSLDQNYPNPFNPTTNIRFNLKKDAKVNLSVYNAVGQLVKSVLDNDSRHAGTHELSVDMSNLPSGVYFSVLKSGNHKVAKKNDSYEVILS